MKEDHSLRSMRIHSMNVHVLHDARFAPEPALAADIGGQDPGFQRAADKPVLKKLLPVTLFLIIGSDEETSSGVRSGGVRLKR
jgi:hypothetical protein